MLLLGPAPSVFMVRFAGAASTEAVLRDGRRIDAAAGVAPTKTAPLWHPSVVAGGFHYLLRGAQAPGGRGFGPLLSICGSRNARGGNWNAMHNEMRFCCGAPWARGEKVLGGTAHARGGEARSCIPDKVFPILLSSPSPSLAPLCRPTQPTWPAASNKKRKKRKSCCCLPPLHGRASRR